MIALYDNLGIWQQMRTLGLTSRQPIGTVSSVNHPITKCASAFTGCNPQAFVPISYIMSTRPWHIALPVDRADSPQAQPVVNPIDGQGVPTIRSSLPSNRGGRERPPTESLARLCR